MVTEEFGIFRPRQFLPASSATEPLPPDFADRPIELPEAPGVRRTSVILVVASELGVEGLQLFVHWLMAVLLAPFGYCRQAPSEITTAAGPLFICMMAPSIPAATPTYCFPSTM